jgi:hypothetical protein
MVDWELDEYADVQDVEGLEVDAEAWLDVW